MVTEEKKEERDVVVMRLNRGLKERLDNLAKKRNTTLTSLSSNAIEKFLDEEEYNFQDFLSVVDSIPSLSIHKQKIEMEMNGCPPIACKQLIDIIQDREVFLFEETPESIEERIKSIDTKDLYGIFTHLTIEDVNKVNEILKKIIEALKNPISLKIGFGARNNHHNRILLFVAYNKKEANKLGENVGEDEKQK